MKISEYFRPVMVVVVALGVSASLWRCSTTENTIDDEKTAIQRYLDGKNLTYTVQAGVYKYTANADREDGGSGTVIAPGDSVKYRFAAYGFLSSGTSGLGSLYYTNIRELIAADTVLNPQYWSFDEKKIRLGATPLVKGLSRGLAGSLEGDSVLFYMTSDLVYGDKPLGVVLPNTPMVWVVKINQVVKQ